MVAGYIEPPITDDRLMLSVPDAARVMSLSRAMVYRLMSSGSLASVKIGARRLVPRRSIEVFVEEQQNARPLQLDRSTMEKADDAAIPES